MNTAQCPSTVEIYARDMLSVLREYGSITREYIRQSCHVGSKSQINKITKRVIELGGGAVLERRNGALVWIPAPRGMREIPFTDWKPVMNAEQRDRWERRNDPLT